MCAIYGILSSSSYAEHCLARMGHVLAHRGPDGCADYHDRQLHLGMRRLAILDRQRGQQPFSGRDGTIQAIFNGEIYNFRALRDELENLGYQFHSDCDGEIIPHAWQEWGLGMLARFNGMFAIAIYDRDAGKLILMRDRCGQKPLYYWHSGGQFLFASEIKGILSARELGVMAKPDVAQLEQYLSLRYVTEPGTFFQGIATLPAGHYMEVPLASVSTPPVARRWWDVPEPEPFDGTPGQAVDLLDGMVKGAVERVIQSDEPLACYLSAGVDSSLLAAYVKELGGDVTTLSMGFDGISDESEEAGNFSKQLGFENHRVVCRGDDLARLPQVVSQMESPVGDALILAFDRLASRTSELGCRVALGGEGADELFAGYSFHSAMLKAESLGSAGRNIAAATLSCLPRTLLNRLAQFPADLGREGLAKTIRYLRSYGQLSAAQKGLDLRTLFERAECNRLLHPDHRHRSDPSDFDWRGDSLDRHLRYQFRGWLQDWAIIRQDKNGMAHSLEYRMPFLDHHLIEFAFSLPNNWKIKGGVDKWIWRQLAAKKLPKAITRRAKQPFYFPLEEYAKSPIFQDYLNDCLSKDVIERRGYFCPDAVRHLIAHADQGEFLPMKKMMSLIILELWHRQFVD